MKTFEIVIYDWDAEVEYERHLIECATYGEMMTFAENLCQKVMEEKDLQGVCWNYKEVN